MLLEDCVKRQQGLCEGCPHRRLFWARKPRRILPKIGRVRENKPQACKYCFDDQNNPIHGAIGASSNNMSSTSSKGMLRQSAWQQRHMRQHNKHGQHRKVHGSKGTWDSRHMGQHNKHGQHGKVHGNKGTWDSVASSKHSMASCDGTTIKQWDNKQTWNGYVINSGTTVASMVQQWHMVQQCNIRCNSMMCTTWS